MIDLRFWIPASLMIIIGNIVGMFTISFIISTLLGGNYTKDYVLPIWSISVTIMIILNIIFVLPRIKKEWDKE